MDDMGAETPTKFAAEQIYLMIDSRYQNNKLTIFTSNYTLDELAERFNNPVDSKPDVMGSRIASRLNQMCGKVKFGDVDWRKKK